MKKKNILASLILFSFLAVISCNKNSDDGVDGDGQPTEVDKTANLRAAGASANDLLANTNFDKLKIEIAYVAGFRPSQDAMTEFVDYIEEHTFKTDIEMVFLELPAVDQEELTIQEIADLELENRTVYNDGKTLGIYIYFTNLPSDEDEEDEGLVTLGAVYRNTSMVIHEATVRRLAAISSIITAADVEIATLNHEFGHLFGLVNLGTTPVNNHEDSEAPNHCNVPGCLMRGELQFSGSGNKSSSLSSKNELKSSCSLSGKSVMQMLENPIAKGNRNSVPLDAECILDLRSNGGR